MERAEAVERLAELLASSEAETVNTSMRLPVALRDAAALVVEELGLAPSATTLAAGALRSLLEAILVQAALEEHYAQHPEARPTLAELAIAAAELDGHPLSRDPEALARAAAELAARHPEAGPDDVILWAEARATPAA
jgi:hypothetical protein